VIDTDFSPLAGPYTRRRSLAVRLLMRCSGALLDVARWLMAPKPDLSRKEPK